MKNTITLILIIIFWLNGNSQHTLKITGNNLKVNGSTSLVLTNTQFVNNGSFDAATGTVIIKGNATASQSAIGGTSTTTFYNLKIDKTTNDVQLQQNIRVDNDLDMTSGNLDLNGSNIVLGIANGQIINESPSSYITGTSGEIEKTVTLNNPNNVNPGNLGVTITSAANLGSTIIKRGHAAQDVNGQFGILRYYDISPTNNLGLNATVQFSYMDHELNGILENELAPFRFNGTDWDEFAVSNNDPVANFVETNNVDQFSKWTLAYAFAALPVELVFFKAIKMNDRRAQLIWQTATEQDNDFFTIERSADGSRFEFLEEVSGAGTSSIPIDYQTFDEQPLNGLNYYRLKQTDFDGSFTYSEIRVLRFDEVGLELTIFPNPTSDVLNISLDHPVEKGMIQLFSEAGQLAWETNINQESFIENVVIENLPKGMYVLRATIDNKIFTEKIIFQ